MTQDQITQLIAAEDFSGLVTKVKETRATDNYADIKDQYDIAGHGIFKTTADFRPDKQILDEKGAVTKIVKLSRLALPLQQKIVKTAAAFLCGNPIKLDSSPNGDAENNYLNIIKKIWQDNKLDYKSKKLAKLMMSETECAELYYNPVAEEGYWQDLNVSPKDNVRLKMRILANSYGDTLYPVFDSTGDMVAFGRGYEITEDGKKTEYFEIYTEKQIIKATSAGSGWTATPEENTIGKIPVIYYSQEQVEWYEVQEMISRLETKLSNHADTNDYFDSPVLFIEGDTLSMPGKEDMGKMIEGEKGAKAYYVTWDQAPESTKMEIENLWRFIHNCTDTPDISFESMKSLGNTPSGYAIELMFMSAHLKAADKEENFGESVQRRINYIKAWLAAVDGTQKQFLPMAIRPKFEYFLPKNNAEKINDLNNAVTGGLMSTETAVRQNPLVHDADNELALIEEENSTVKQLDSLMGGIVKPIAAKKVSAK